MSRNKGVRQLKKALQSRNKVELRKLRNRHQGQLNLLEDRGDEWNMSKYVAMMKDHHSKILRDIDRVLDT